MTDVRRRPSLFGAPMSKLVPTKGGLPMLNLGELRQNLRRP